MDELFDELIGGRAPLMAHLASVRPVVEALGHHRELATSQKAKKEELWQWYGLSRVNELLVGGLAGELPHQSEYLKKDLHRRDALFQYDALVHGNLPAVAAAEYGEFFKALGFTLVEGGHFSPFRHEIVEVVEGDGDQVEHVFWPGLMFGELLFARAGVRVRSRRFAKAIAERSPLYFSWWRPHRETEDLSHGWGHNSQWRTAMRRDYASGGKLHYNVDGMWPVEKEIAQRPDSDLTMEERIELLTHRCFVQCQKRAWGRWPFGDRFVTPA